MADAA